MAFSLSRIFHLYLLHLGKTAVTWEPTGRRTGDPFELEGVRVGLGRALEGANLVSGNLIAGDCTPPRCDAAGVAAYIDSLETP